MATTVRPPENLTAARARLTRARTLLAQRDDPANRQAVADAWAVIDKVLDQWKH